MPRVACGGPAAVTHAPRAAAPAGLMAVPSLIGFHLSPWSLELGGLGCREREDELISHHARICSIGSRPARGTPDGAAGDRRLRCAAVGDGGGDGTGPRVAGDALLRFGGRLLRRGGAPPPSYRQSCLPRRLHQISKYGIRSYGIRTDKHFFS